MNLRTRAEADLAHILEDGVNGFGWPITVTAPGGTPQKTLTGFSDDISQIIDPDTGQAVSGRMASATLRISSLVAAGFTELPVAVSDSSKKPWTISFNDINGNTYLFKVEQSNPDRALGIVALLLELYE